MKKIEEYISTVEGVTQMYEDIDEIMNTFDFKRVQTVMDALDWEWAVPKGELEDYKQTRTVFYNPDYPDFATYRPEYEDIIKWVRKFLLRTIHEAAKESDYEYTSSTGGFFCHLWVLEDDARKAVFGENAPDDFKHSVDIHLQFVAEENMPKSW